MFLSVKRPDRRLPVQHRHRRLLQQQEDLPEAAEPAAEELLQVLPVQHSEEVSLLGHVPGEMLIPELRGQVLQHGRSSARFETKRYLFFPVSAPFSLRIPGSLEH